MEETSVKTKFCKFCGEKIPEEAVICTHCGRQVEQLKSEQPQVVVNNNNTNTNTNINAGRFGRAKNKWVSLVLCIKTKALTFLVGVFYYARKGEMTYYA